MITLCFRFCHPLKIVSAALGVALFGVGPATGYSQEAVETEVTETETVSTGVMGKDGKELTPEELAEAERLFKGAHQAFLQGDIKKAKQQIEVLSTMTPGNSSVMNLLGAVHTKQKNYEGAMAAFQKAVELAPNDFRPRFNLAEVDFLQQKYPEARAKFNKLYEDDPTNELAAYKVYLTYLLEGNGAMADQMLVSFNEFSDWPTYYFAQASKSFQAGETEDAQDWIISARKIYPGGRNSLYAETMLDLGWINQEQFDRIKVTAREAVIDFKQPLRVPKEIAKDLGMMKKRTSPGGRKKINDPTKVKSKPFEAEKVNVDLPPVK